MMKFKDGQVLIENSLEQFNAEKFHDLPCPEEQPLSHFAETQDKI